MKRLIPLIFAFALLTAGCSKADEADRSDEILWLESQIIQYQQVIADLEAERLDLQVELANLKSRVNKLTVKFPDVQPIDEETAFHEVAWRHEGAEIVCSHLVEIYLEGLGTAAVWVFDFRVPDGSEGTAHINGLTGEPLSFPQFLRKPEARSGMPVASVGD